MYYWESIVQKWTNSLGSSRKTWMLGNLFCTDIFTDVSALALSIAGEMPMRVMLLLFLSTECHQVIRYANNDALTKVRELHCAFSINFYLCVLEVKENLSLHGKGFITGLKWVLSLSLMNLSLWDFSFKKRNTTLEYWEGEKNMVDFTKRCGKLKIHQVYNVFLPMCD